MRLGWTMLLPLAVLNAVITAVVVALNLPWWVSGLAGLAVILTVLVVIRSRETREGLRFSETKGAQVLPSSVRLVKLTSAATSEPEKAVEKAQTAQA